MTDTQFPEKTEEQKIVKEIYDLTVALNDKLHRAAMFHSIYCRFELKHFTDFSAFHHQVVLADVPSKVTMVWP